MYPVDTPLVIVHRRVREHSNASQRLDRMMRSIKADRVLELDDEGLKELLRTCDWVSSKQKRTGQYRMNRQPALFFTTFRSFNGPEFEPGSEHLARAGLTEVRAWSFRDASKFRRLHRCVCQSAYEIHCAFGCLHACDYCHIGPLFTITLNLEELAERIRSFGETIPWQKLYKFDNHTDTICLEPEYGASEVMVRLFSNWDGRFLMLYTKSDNVEHLLSLPHNHKTIISWSLACRTSSKKVEKRTPALEERIYAIELCQRAGYRVRVRLSPICPIEGWREEYHELIRELLGRTSPDVITIDVLGWMDAQTMKEAIDTSLFEENYANAVDELIERGAKVAGKHLFPHRLRLEILRFVIDEIQRVSPQQRVAICMETLDMWQELGERLGMHPDNYVCCCGPTSVPGHPLLPD